MLLIPNLLLHKQIRALLEAQGAQGKHVLVRQIPHATTAQYAVRDWILPFMLHFTDLLKVLWTLWAQLKRKQQEAEMQKLTEEKQRAAAEQLAHLQGMQQLAEEAAAAQQQTQQQAEQHSQAGYTPASFQPDCLRTGPDRSAAPEG